MGVGDTAAMSLQVEGSRVALAEDSQGTITQRLCWGQHHCASGRFFRKMNMSAYVYLATYVVSMPSLAHARGPK